MEIRDTIDQQMLSRAAEIVKKVSAREVTITLSDRRESSQGLIVSSSDGRIAYNNLVKNRLLRSRSEFENLLEGELWPRK